MRLITKQVPDSFNLFLFGDTHEGSILFYKHGFNKFVNAVCSEFDGVKENYAIHHGDTIEAIVIDDRRFDIDTIGKDCIQPLVQAEKHIEHLRPIRENIVCLLQGNHEHALYKFGDIAGYICNKLDLEYGTYAAKITFVDADGNTIFKHFCTHGRKGIGSIAGPPKRRLTNMLVSLQNHLQFKAGDCITMSKGHTHKLLVYKPDPQLYLTDNGTEITQNYTEPDPTADYIPPDFRYYINTGSFLKLYGDGVSGYAERAEYDPVELGYAVVMVRDRQIEDVRRIVV